MVLRTHGDRGVRQPRSAGPPSSIEAWRADQQADGHPPEQVAQIESILFISPLTHGAFVTKSPQARTHVQRIEEQRSAITDEFQRRHEALQTQRHEDQMAYGDALVEAVRDRAASMYPALPVQIEVSEEPVNDLGTHLEAFDSPEARLVEHARKHTPLPGSGSTPMGYRPG